MGESPPGPPGDPSVRAEREVHQRSWGAEGQAGKSRAGGTEGRWGLRWIPDRGRGEVAEREKTSQCVIEDVQGSLRPLGTERKDEILCRPSHGGEASFPSFSAGSFSLFLFFTIAGILVSLFPGSASHSNNQKSMGTVSLSRK